MFVAAHNGARIWGGAERATARLLAGLQRRGHRVLLYCNSPLVAERADRMGVPAALLPLGGDIALPHALRFAARLRRGRPDALIVGTYRKLFLAALGAHLARVPRVVARIGLETDVPRSWKYRVALQRWVDVVVVNADAIRPAFLELPGWNAARVPVIHNGVVAPPRAREEGAVRRELGLGAEQPVIGAVARLAEQKRLDRLLRVTDGLPPEVHCVLAGEGECRAALERMASDLGIAERVHFLGHREDVGDVLAAMDVYVVCSDREGLSNSMLEAVASGVPVVSTRVSGARDALRAFHDGTTPGVIVGFQDDELRAAVAGLLADSHRLKRMGQAARRRAEEFDMEAAIDRWERILAPEAAAEPR